MQTVWEDLADNGWSFTDELQNSGTVRKLERNGLILSHDSHWSVQQYFVGSTKGGWGDLQLNMARVGLQTRGDDNDLLEAAAHSDLIKGYLDSERWKSDELAARRRGMENLREFERSVGMKESWLAGEEDDLRQMAKWKSEISGLSGLKYWGAAAFALIYLIYKFATAEDKVRAGLMIGIPFAIMFGGLLVLRMQKKI